MGARSRSRRRSRHRGTVIRGWLAFVGLLIAAPSFTLSVLSISSSRYDTPISSQLAGAAAVTASVPENPYNTLAMQLDARATSLDEREAALRDREGVRNVIGVLGDYMGFASFFLSITILLLLSYNFYLDARRGIVRPLAIPERFKVDLRRTK